MSAPETRQPCQDGPARTGARAWGQMAASRSQSCWGAVGCGSALAWFPGSGTALPTHHRASPGLRACPGTGQGVLGAKWVQGS